MTDLDPKRLLDGAPLELLDPAEAAALADHLDDCAPCSRDAAKLGEAYRSWAAASEREAAAAEPWLAELEPAVLTAVDAADDDLGGAVGGRVEEAVGPTGGKKKGFAPITAEPGRDAAALGIKVKLTCAYCHDATTRSTITFCATCLAPHHRDCFSEHGKCSTLGCEETRTVRPSTPDLDAAVGRGRRPRGKLTPLVALLSAGAVGAAAYGGVAAWSAQRDSAAASRQAATDAAARAARQEQSDRELEAAEAARRLALEQRGAELLGQLRAALERGEEREAREALQRLEAFAELSGAQSPELAEAAAALVAEGRRLFLPLEAAPRMDLEATGEGLREVVARIARAAGRNLVLAPGVDERVTISLRGVRWYEALRAVAELTRCELEERPGGIVLVSQPPKVSIQFTAADIRTVLHLLAAYSGKNILMSDEIDGVVTTDFKEVHWAKALVSLARSVGGVAWQASPELVTVLPAGQQPPPGAVPLHEVLRSFRPLPLEVADGEVKVELRGRGTLRQLVGELARQSGHAIGLVGDPAAPLEVALTGVPWRDALRELGRRSGYCVVETAERPTLVPGQQNVLTATEAPLVPWLRVLSALAGRDLLIGPGVGGVVTADLRDVDVLATLEATAATLGFGVSAGAVLEVRPRASGPVSTPEAAWLEADGVRLPPLQATALAGERRYAILGGRPYEEGDALLDPAREEELPLRVALIERQRVALVEDDGGRVLCLLRGAGTDPEVVAANEEYTAKVRANLVTQELRRAVASAVASWAWRRPQAVTALREALEAAKRAEPAVWTRAEALLTRMEVALAARERAGAAKGEQALAAWREVLALEAGAPRSEPAARDVLAALGGEVPSEEPPPADSPWLGWDGSSEPAPEVLTGTEGLPPLEPLEGR